jgi:hypothetical protein
MNILSIKVAELLMILVGKNTVLIKLYVFNMLSNCLNLDCLHPVACTRSGSEFPSNGLRSPTCARVNGMLHTTIQTVLRYTDTLNLI